MRDPLPSGHPTGLFARGYMLLLEQHTLLLGVAVVVVLLLLMMLVVVVMPLVLVLVLVLPMVVAGRAGRVERPPRARPVP